MFNEKEIMLENEASLVSSLLGNGLNSLRKSNLNNRGLYYQAFFSLAMGLERLLKIILITQYRVQNNGEFPKQLPLKDYGHDLLKLTKLANINLNDKNDIHYHILEFLNNFSQKARYYNLDNIINDNSKNNLDPLADWAKIENLIYETIPRKNNIANKKALVSLTDTIVDLKMYDLNSSFHNSSEIIIEEMEKRTKIQEYATLYVYELIKTYVLEIQRLQNEKYMMPVLTENFLVYIAKYTKTEIRKKKNFLRVD